MRQELHNITSKQHDSSLYCFTGGQAECLQMAFPSKNAYVHEEVHLWNSPQVIQDLIRLISFDNEIKMGIDFLTFKYMNW